VKFWKEINQKSLLFWLLLRVILAALESQAVLTVSVGSIAYLIHHHDAKGLFLEEIFRMLFCFLRSFSIFWMTFHFCRWNNHLALVSRSLSTIRKIESLSNMNKALQSGWMIVKIGITFFLDLLFLIVTVPVSVPSASRFYSRRGFRRHLWKLSFLLLVEF